MGDTEDQWTTQILTLYHNEQKQISELSLSSNSYPYYLCNFWANYTTLLSLNFLIYKNFKIYVELNSKNISKK